MENPDANPPDGAQILIVEDSPTQAVRLEYVLRLQGYRLLVARNGREALAAVRQHLPALVISDIIMPEMDGYQLCDRLKKDAQLKNIPVILLTSLTDPVDVMKGLECGADNLIFKPYKDQYLLARIASTLANWHLRESENTQSGVEILFAGRKFSITSDRLQILNLLLSTYEAAVDKNRELAAARDELRHLNENLEVLVAGRTASLEAEILERRRAEDEVRRLNAGLEQRILERTTQLEAAKSVAEKANLAKSDFLSSMSHELRSPLNAILGFAQLMESASPLPTDSQKENISQILQAGWHLLNLINEVLDLAAIESGKLSMSLEPVALADVLVECQAMLEPEAQQRGILMTFPRLDRPVFVQADRTRLKQIMINLLSNAIKYNKANGTIVVDVTPKNPGRIRIAVTDTGAGLAPEKLAQLFQPFNRLGQEESGVEGTGIGMVVTKRLAELMEGTLGVDSTVGVGSVFWCDLFSAMAPTLKVPGGGPGAPAQLEAPGATRVRTLLYVEDNPANMKLIEQLVERRTDLRLLTAVNGNLGIKLARDSRPEVILMDINLPGISGIEALQVLRSDPVTSHIPVVALSANAMPNDIEKGMQAGFFRFLTKPIRINEFMATLDAALEFAEQKNPAANAAGRFPEPVPSAH